MEKSLSHFYYDALTTDLISENFILCLLGRGSEKTREENAFQKSSIQTQSPIIALCKSLIIQGNKVSYTREGDNTNEICLNLSSAGCWKRRKTLKLGNNTIQMIMFLVSQKKEEN